MKRGGLLTICTLVLISFLLFSCLPSFDAQNLILNDPRVKAFLEENPNADITIVHFAKQESLTEAEIFKEVCGKALIAEKELYKAELLDPTKGLKIIAYLDAESKAVDCVRRYGAEGRTAGSSPTATPTPEKSTDACGNGKIDGTCSKPEYLNWQACTVQPDWKRGTWSGELCDDGNTQEGDGCSSSCNWECSDSDGSNPKVKGTASGTIYDGTFRNNIEEECITENGKSRVGEWSCSSNGLLSVLYYDCPEGCLDGACVSSPTTAPTTQPAPTTSACGNGQIDGTCSDTSFSTISSCLAWGERQWTGESCDDSNTNNDDDCTSSCIWKCSDTDNGVDTNLKGTTKGRSSTTNQISEAEDICLGGGETVMEFRCDKFGYVRSGSFVCGSIKTCKDGACVPKTNTTATPTVPACTDSDGGSDKGIKGQTKGLNYNGVYVVFDDRCNGIKIEEGFCTEKNTVAYISSPCSSGCSDGACLEEAAPAPTAVCGNGVKEGSEACDDGNTASGDGCSSTCQFDRRLTY